MVVSATRGQAGQMATPPSVTGVPSPLSGRPSCAWPLRAASASRRCTAWTTSTAPGRRREFSTLADGVGGHLRVPAGTWSSRSVPTAATVIPTTFIISAVRRTLLPHRPRRVGPDGHPAPARAATALLPVLPVRRSADLGAAGDLADQPTEPLCGDAELPHPRGRGVRHHASRADHVQIRCVPAGFLRGGAGRGGR